MTWAPSDRFMFWWAVFAIVALAAVGIVSIPLITHPERPWLGLDTPAAVSSQ